MNHLHPKNTLPLDNNSSKERIKMLETPAWPCHPQRWSPDAVQSSFFFFHLYLILKHNLFISCVSFRWFAGEVFCFGFFFFANLVSD